MYNFLFAFVICATVFVIGEIVSTVTKAWIPSVFVTAVIMLVGYWTVLPKELISDSLLIPFGSQLGIFLLVTHMGTVISLKQLKEQWKTIVICLVGLAGMCALSMLIAPMFMDRTLVIAGLPPLTGGIVAATVMSDAAAAAGLEVASVFAITMYCIQGFAGYPLTAVCLQIEGKRLLKEFRDGKASTDAAAKTGAEAEEDPQDPYSPRSQEVRFQRCCAAQAWYSGMAGLHDGHRQVPRHRHHQRRHLGPHLRCFLHHHRFPGSPVPQQGQFLRHHYVRPDDVRL